MADRVLRRFAVNLRRDPVGIVLLSMMVIIVVMVLAAPLQRAVHQLPSVYITHAMSLITPQNVRPR